jgi:hypothetical protein
LRGNYLCGAVSYFLFISSQSTLKLSTVLFVCLWTNPICLERRRADVVGAYQTRPRMDMPRIVTSAQCGELAPHTTRCTLHAALALTPERPGRL